MSRTGIRELTRETKITKIDDAAKNPKHEIQSMPKTQDPEHAPLAADPKTACRSKQ
jgi:hypothetical protein